MVFKQEITTVKRKNRKLLLLNVKTGNYYC